MKIAFIGDSHLGYFRFDEDAYVQAKRAFEHASENSDVIVHVGDLFDTRIPKLNTLEQAMNILKIPKKKGITVYLIHGNHDRRGRGLTSALDLLDNVGLIKYVNNEIIYLEDKSAKNMNNQNKRIGILAIGNVPDEISKKIIDKIVQLKGKPKDVDFSILVIHQTVNEFMKGMDNILSIFDLEKLGFNLIVDGHIHKFHVGLDGRFLIPGSTVLTQLKKEEVGDKGYILYDTEAKSFEFIPIKTREFIYKEMKFENAGLGDVVSAVNKFIADLNQKIEATHENPIVKIKLKGTLKDGLKASDIYLKTPEWVSLDNRLNEKIIEGEIEHVRHIRESTGSLDDIMASKIREKAKDKITTFDPIKVFDLLINDKDKAKEMIYNEE